MGCHCPNSRRSYLFRTSSNSWFKITLLTRVNWRTRRGGVFQLVGRFYLCISAVRIANRKMSQTTSICGVASIQIIMRCCDCECSLSVKHIWIHIAFLFPVGTCVADSDSMAQGREHSKRFTLTGVSLNGSEYLKSAQAVSYTVHVCCWRSFGKAKLLCHEDVASGFRDYSGMASGLSCNVCPVKYKTMRNK